jgi:hypothetical protein
MRTFIHYHAKEEDNSGVRISEISVNPILALAFVSFLFVCRQIGVRPYM